MMIQRLKVLFGLCLVAFAFTLAASLGSPLGFVGIVPAAAGVLLAFGVTIPEEDWHQ
jgi:hypothetical protein